MLVLKNVQPGQEGDYNVVVTDKGGTVISKACSLTVRDNLSDDPSESLIVGQVASWSFDDSLASGIEGFDGEAINGATLTDDARVGSGAISLKQAQEQYVDIDRQVLSDGALAYSSAGWFKVTGGEGRRFLWETSPSNWAVSTEVTPAGNVKAFTKLADGSSHSADSGMVPGVGEWHHFAVTFDGVSGQSAIYYDGEKVDVSFTTPVGVGTADTGGFHIGSFRGGNGRFFEGLIDEVGIWNRVLHADEIAYLAEGNVIPEPEQEVAPVVITQVQISEGNVRIEWEGGNPPFQVQSRTSLNEGVWENVSDPISETIYEEGIDAVIKFFQVVQP